MEPKLYQLYCLVMYEIVVERLLQERSPNGPLPSVRSLARSFGVSPQTVQKALGELARRGEIHVLDRKGAFWGKEPPRLPLGTEPSGEGNALERLGTDLRRGVFHPFKPLPSRKELAGLYGVSVRRIGQFLEEWVREGRLDRRGRSYHLPPPLVRSSQGALLVVVRCDSTGRILLESERETDFLKAVRREASERDLRVLVVGCHEGTDGFALLDPQGNPLASDRLSAIAVGVIVSTWLLRDPLGLIHVLRRWKLPISVWWEHEVAKFRPVGGSRAPVAAFNLSFGEAPGRAVGERLVAEGCSEVAWISPYHGNAWSTARLEGLRKAMGVGRDKMVECVDTHFHSRWHMDQLGGGAKGGGKLLRKVLEGFLDRGVLGPAPVWVVATDEAAVVLLEILRERGLPRPRIVAFDASSASESLRFDSFEFHTEGMVRRMLHHIFHPSALAEDREPLQEMVGRIVLRG